MALEELKVLAPPSTPSAVPTASPKPRRLYRRILGSGKVLALLLGVAGVASAAYLGRDRILGSGKVVDRPLTAVVRRATLRVAVNERGNLESTVTVDGTCELNGYQNKIIELVAEGSRVEKGQVVCRFDSSEIDKSIAQQQIKSKQAKSKIETSKQELEIARNDAESEEVKAKGDLKVAELTRILFEEGTNPADLDEAQSKIKLATKDVEKTSDELDKMQGLVKKGFKSPQQLRPLENSLEQYKFMKSSEERRYTVKKTYEKEKNMVENASKVQMAQKAVDKAAAQGKAKVAKADSEVVSAVGTHEIEEQQLQEFLKQKAKTEIKAGQTGILAYANEAYYDSSRQIREGATVYSRQKIFSIPDLTRMQVKVNIHESMIKKIKADQKATIRVDAFPNLELIGIVKTVSNLADSNRGWMNGGVKEYSTVVDVQNTPPDSSLKPGMSAEVVILVQEMRDVLQVPIQAIAERKGAFYAFVEKDGAFLPKPVKVGETDEKFVEILSGLDVGEVVTLDARTRSAVYFKEDDRTPLDKPEPAKPATKGP
ncbi:efflux RND transporter periplasmic adaptor subunit [Isosphaeraceae bacterium EP7]